MSVCGQGAARRGGAMLMACLVSALCVACSAAPEGRTLSGGETGQIRVSLTGLRNKQGQVLVNLFDAARGFPNRTQRARETRILNATDIPVARFENLPYGTYAVSVVHDENSNDKLDTGLLGVPTEGYGASNNPEPGFGPPDFSESAFELRQPVRRVEVALTYRL
ncbi:MAG: DUF2141 domain-containing protein [Candidatus Brocadiia bacterium]